MGTANYNIMAKVSYYLDKRRAKADGTFPIRVCVTRHKKQMYIGTPFSSTIEDWDAAAQLKVNKKEFKVENTLLYTLLGKLRNLLLILEVNNELRDMTNEQLMERIAAEMGKAPKGMKMIQEVMNDYIAKSGITEHSANSYRTMFSNLSSFKSDKIRLDDISLDTIMAFDKYMENKGLIQNTRRSMIQRLSTLFNHAIKHGYTKNNPFLLYKRHKLERTRSRALTVEQLKEIRDKVLHRANIRYHRDIFMLQFYLLGINMADLYSLRHEDYSNGRITYKRQKTGKDYDVLVPEEAQRLIERYKGRRNLLCLADDYSTADIATKSININLGRLIKGVTTYWSRHSVATLMINELHTPIEIVSAALGHEYGSRITNVYINLDQKLVDDAQLKMIELLK